MTDRDRPSLQARLAAVLGEVLPVRVEDDGAVTVSHAGTAASLRVVAVAEDLELVSLTQVLAFDAPDTPALRDTVRRTAAGTQLGTVLAIDKDPDASSRGNASGGGNDAAACDVMLRYNFPGAGLGDDALRTLVLMVLERGAEVHRALTGG